MIAKCAVVPHDEDCVLIERVVGRSFVANGSARSGLTISYFTPAPFDTRKAAVNAALVWARANGVPIVYVRCGEP